MSIGENIRRLRKQKNMTQKELGERLGGISQQQIGQWENGNKNPKIETLFKISQALNVSVGDLDPTYGLMITDRDKATYLADILKEYLEKKSKENASEDIISATTITLNKVQSYIEATDALVSIDKEKQELLNRMNNLKEEIQKEEEEIQKEEHEIGQMILSILRHLNPKGQDKVLGYAIDLIKIPEYQSKELTIK